MPVDFARVSFSLTEFRKVTQTDASVKTRDPLSTELEFNSLLDSEADATTFASQILDLRKVNGRNDWSLTIRKGAINPDIGDTITIVYPRFGLNAGRNFIVKRMKRSQSSLYDEFTLFGPQ